MGQGEAVVESRRKSANQAVYSAFAGAVSGAVARFVVGPLDVLKIRFQAKALAERLGLIDGPLGPSVSFVSGALAGVTATMASYPFDLLRTRMAAQGEPKVYDNMVIAAKDIVKRNGFKGLYAGLKPTLIEIIPYASLQFGLYDLLNRGMTDMRYHALASMPWQRAPARENMKPSTVQQFLCGLLAGVCAKLGTHPLDVAKKRFQVAGLMRCESYGARVDPAVTRSLWGCLVKTYESEGVRGLYKGAGPSILKSAPQAAVTFAVYEWIMRQCNKRSRM